MKKRPLIVVLFAVACLLYPVLAVLQRLVTQPGGMADTIRNFAWPFEIRMGAAEPHVAWQQIVGGAALLGSWLLASRLRNLESR